MESAYVPLYILRDADTIAPAATIRSHGTMPQGARWKSTRY